MAVVTLTNCCCTDGGEPGEPVEVECCPGDPVARNLFWSIPGVGTIELTYDPDSHPDFPLWINGSVDLSALSCDPAVVSVKWMCNELAGPSWQLLINDEEIPWGGSQSCDPFQFDLNEFESLPQLGFCTIPASTISD